MKKYKIAVLDDYQNVALESADWSVLRDRADIAVFQDHLADPDAVIERLLPFDVVCVMRERSPLPRNVIERLPNLKLIASTGSGNASIDVAAASEHGIAVVHTELKEQLRRAIKEVPNFDKMKNHIDITVTNEGLRIELTESEKGRFFDSGSAKISGDGAELLKTLAEELGKLPNTLAMEGHTNSKPSAAGKNYANWELSSDRANAARRLMQLDGIREDQVTQVRGFADQRLRKKEDSLDAANRRISLIVQYLSKPEPTAGAAGEKSS
jgi:flagellar motor protein MotB